MRMTGTVLFLMIIVFIVLWGLGHDWRKSAPQQRRVPAPCIVPREEPRTAEEERADRELYAKTNKLVAFFVGRMQEIGNPGLSPGPAPEWIPTKPLSKLGKGIPLTKVPDEIDLPPEGAWWGGVYLCSCITPRGDWEYRCTSIVYDPDVPSPDDVSAFWVLASTTPEYRRSTLKSNQLYPYIPWYVDHPSTATVQHAYEEMVGIMARMLERYRPDTLEDLSALTS
jgi:hypothetical protein